MSVAGWLHRIKRISRIVGTIQRALGGNNHFNFNSGLIPPRYAFAPNHSGSFLFREYNRAMATAIMTQTQILKTLAAACDVPAKTARLMITSLGEIAVREVKKNGLFVMPGLGRLVRVDRKARTGRNPATGEAIKIAAKKVVKFRVAKSAKDAIVPVKVKK